MIAELLTVLALIPVTCATTPPGVDGFYNPTLQTITLARKHCAAIARSIKLRRTGARSWLVFAHEVSHHLGYDHGEFSEGAECHGEKIDRRLMRRAGIPAKAAARIDDDLKVGGCLPGGFCPSHPEHAICILPVPIDTTSLPPTIGLP